MRRGRFAGPKMARGQGTHGAKWCFVTPSDEMLDYKNNQNDAERPMWQLFHSQKEARRYVGLRVLQRMGRIRNLACQVPLPLLAPIGFTAEPTTKRDPEPYPFTGRLAKIGTYKVDFTYEEPVWGPALDDYPCMFEPIAARCPTLHTCCGFHPDGTIHEHPTWRMVYEEVKGYQEDLYRWKRRHFERQFGVPLKVT